MLNQQKRREATWEEKSAAIEDHSVGAVDTLSLFRVSRK